MSALVLIAIGLHALVAYRVSRRTREIGIRMALGARPVQIAIGTLRWVLAISGPHVSRRPAP